MSDERPNILLIVTDQQRGDCLGIEDHPVLQTPYLDQIGGQGAHFRRAYSACPVCVPARRTLMTGTKASTHGVTMNYDTHLNFPTLPGELSKAGYQTHLCGKLHLHPARKLHGFDSADWADSTAQRTLGRINNDYQQFLLDHGQVGPDLAHAGGANANGPVSRPFTMDERFHYTNWAAEMALRFLERRDPTVPFFLNLSIFAPHPPCLPPDYYFQKYMDMELPSPSVGDWARVYDKPERGQDVARWRVSLDRQAEREMMAGYFGSIEHADHQIGRVLNMLPENTVIMFVSDHGEMLGDHQWIRKRSAYEGSASIPFLLRLPDRFGVQKSQKIDQLVELMDVMPTLLDVAEVAIPETVDGESVLPLMQGEDAGWREHLHGECAELPTTNSGVQFITNGKHKYVYYPGTGIEEFFDLTSDPKELVNQIKNPEFAEEAEALRQKLTKELKGRPEAFVEDGKLATLGGPSPQFLPGFERVGDDGSGPGLLNGDR